MVHIQFNRRIKYILAAFIATLLGIEWVSYAVLPWSSWPEIPLHSKDALRILLVGDPQLLGEKDSFPGILGIFERWDSDRFIQKTFSYCFQYIKPHVIIMLGDNFDEGAIATTEEFGRYFRRFVHTFHAANFDSVIFVPGDNDIGGEDQSPSPMLLKRFDYHFRKDTFIQKSFLDIVKVNVLFHSSEDHKDVPPPLENRIRIAVSHMPLTSLYISYIGKILPVVKPHLIFSAHEHTSAHIISNRDTGEHLQMFSWLKHEKQMHFINLTENYMHEIIVPTCSYRMGTEDVGYGAAVIEPDGRMAYIVLWLPSRLMQLKILLGVIIFLIFLSMAFCCRVFVSILLQSST